MDFNSSEYTLDTILRIKLGPDAGRRANETPEIISPGLPSLMQKFFGTTEQLEAFRRFHEQWRRISKASVYRAVCAKITQDGSPSGTECNRNGEEGLIVRGARTAGCQNWFMELDVTGPSAGDIWRWAEFWRPSAVPIFDQIEAWLPTARACTSDVHCGSRPAS
jgi:hypothetical protein